jgi:hypothetical protein
MALINSLTVSILPSQQRFNRRLRPEPPVSIIGVGYTRVRVQRWRLSKIKSSDEFA